MGYQTRLYGQLTGAWVCNRGSGEALAPFLRVA
jgi:hypothetical protein